MREFDALADIRKNDRVIAHDVAAANGVYADLAQRAFAHDADTTVPCGVVQMQLAHVRQNFRERFCGAARRVLFQAMVHLDDFEVEVRAEDFRRLAREPEERVDAGGKIRGPHDGNFRLVLLDLERVGVRVAGGADDQRLLVFGAKLGYRDGRRVRAEINYHVALADDGGEVVALINLGDDFESVDFFLRTRRALGPSDLSIR